MAETLHQAVEMIINGSPPQLILEFLGAVDKETEKLARSISSEEMAIDSVELNSNTIRQEAIAAVAKKFFLFK